MRIFLFFCVFFVTFGFSQDKVSKVEFVPPLAIPLATSGTFGELRSNHFHSGLDLKTEGKEGFPVHATADGMVTRIKISHFGYGKAIYIKHPNGYTSVYAHLKQFAPKIEAYVKKRQYAKESYAIELYPKSESIPVTQGELIGLSGNTGGSGGPHLHFEIRDNRARPMNPMQFGMDIKDTQKPNINSIWAYALDKKSHVNGQQEPCQLRLIPDNNGDYTTENLQAYGKIGFGVSAIDQQDSAPNKNGVYNISSEVNGITNFELEMNKFSFSETRYINRLIDYSHYKKNKERITKLFIQKNNPLSIYKNRTNNKGVITIKDSLSYLIKINIKDYKNNTAIIKINTDGRHLDSISKPKTDTTSYLARRSENNLFNTGIFDLIIPKNSLYDDVYLDIKTKGDTIQVHKKEVPLHKKMTIAFDVSNYAEKDRKKLYIAHLNNKKKPSYVDTKKRQHRFSTKTRTFGSYTLALDSIPPQIIPINVVDKKSMTKETHLKIKINDSETKIDRFRGTINGKFILMEYDYKTGMLVYDFEDKVISEQENKFKLVVFDKVGNNTTFETTFYRKP